MSAKSKKLTWPVVSWSDAEQAWKVDARTKEGGSRRFFEKKIEADTFAQQCRIQRQNSGTSAFGSAELARYGKTVQHAIDFYLAHLAASEKTVPVEQAVEELITLRRAAGRDPEYLRGLTIRLGRFKKDHPGTLMGSFETGALNLWLAKLPYAPATRNTFRRDLVTLFSFAKDHDYVDRNPAEKTDLATDVDQPVGILTVPQASALLIHAGPDLAAYVAIGLFAGLRASELAKLDWSEIDIEGGHILVTAAKSKTRRRRLVPIQPNLKEWLLRNNDIGPVAPKGLRKRFEALRTAAGIQDWPNNALRHSFGSYRLAQCQDAAMVSLEMGNSEQMVFGHYREIVKPKDAERYWNLFPQEVSGKIVAIA